MDVREPTEEEKRKICKAAENGNLDTLQQLISSGVNVTGIVYDDGQWTALHYAAKCGYSSIVESLIKCGANIDALNNHQWTPLHFAVFTGHSSTVESLIKCGADVNAVTRDQSTPLHHAAQRGHSSVVKSLVKCGANVNAVDKHKITPLEWAVWGNHSDIVHYFITEVKVDSTKLLAQEKISKLLKEAEEKQSSSDKLEQDYSDCFTARATIKEQYDELFRLPVDSLLPTLYANDVVTLYQKEAIEKMPEKKYRIAIVLDLIIRSLDSGVPVPYNGFLKVLKENEDLLTRELAKKLAPSIC